MAYRALSVFVGLAGLASAAVMHSVERHFQPEHDDPVVHLSVPLPVSISTYDDAVAIPASVAAAREPTTATATATATATSWATTTILTTPFVEVVATLTTVVDVTERLYTDATAFVTETVLANKVGAVELAGAREGAGTPTTTTTITTTTTTTQLTGTVMFASTSTFTYVAATTTVMRPVTETVTTGTQTQTTTVTV
ncbi:hypothetical protein SPI_04068 [Niveomyces insectorum RCEF 264]|uniref:Uncharacterized protein n=1 Tax=Niveomyces insectorum RCEF 264 TaxID=1081102 RepID=A0A167VEL4_9HYPO|nr:hypothetical protein SPI_04068 [Niveomyces insectorum RCEF 264]